MLKFRNLYHTQRGPGVALATGRNTCIHAENTPNRNMITGVCLMIYAAEDMRADSASENLS